MFLWLLPATAGEHTMPLCAVYEWQEHVRPEDGKPSRRDHDYHGAKLELNGKGNYTLTRQRGRLDPEFTYEYGVFNIEYDSLLRLNITHIADKFTGNAMQESRGSYIMPIRKYNRLYHEGKYWEANGCQLKD